MFLVAGYLVSAKLKANMVFIVVAVFTVAAFLQGSILFLSSQDALGALGQIAQRANIDPVGAWLAHCSFLPANTGQQVILFEYVPITLDNSQLPRRTHLLFPPTPCGSGAIIGAHTMNMTDVAWLGVS